MDQETHALVRHLFAEITVVLETAQGLAVDGQDVDRSPAGALVLVTGLEAALVDAASIVAAARGLLGRAPEPRLASAAQRRRRSPST